MSAEQARAALDASPAWDDPAADPKRDCELVVHLQQLVFTQRIRTETAELMDRGPLHGYQLHVAVGTAEQVERWKRVVAEAARSVPAYLPPSASVIVQNCTA